MEYRFLISNFKQKVLKLMLSNYGLLSATIACGISNQQMMFF